MKKEDILALAKWDPKAEPDTEIAFHPARVLMQDFTGVPAVVDLAAMREAVVAMGGDPARVNPLSPADLVIDHSVQVDNFASSLAFGQNVDLEYERNRERYEFLRWGQSAFKNFRVVPPATGICHQVNLEYLAKVVWTNEEGVAYPDTLVGTDSHTTMINGLGVLGWGVGGIEAEAAMLGQPVSMLIPDVVGFKLFRANSPKAPPPPTSSSPSPRCSARRGSSGSSSSSTVPASRPSPSPTAPPSRTWPPSTAPRWASSRSTARRSSTSRFTGPPKEVIDLVEAYCKEQGLFRAKGTPGPAVLRHPGAGPRRRRAVLAGPKRPQDRVPLKDAKKVFRRPSRGWSPRAKAGRTPRSPPRPRAPQYQAPHGRGGDRGDHLVHQHVEPGRHARRRPRRQEGCRARHPGEAVGEDLARARLQGRHRVPAQGGSRHLSRRTRLQPRGLRLHHLHRQLGPAPRRRLRGREERRPRRRLCPLGQPQLRGARQPAG
ncbi:MAG: hypothetical protein IPP07_28400 [Holophagales bacterium]|nr:hypothetical protein [Holophagales bacterium]